MDGSNERPEGRPAARPMPLGSRATEDVNRVTPPGVFLGRRRFLRAIEAEIHVDGIPVETETIASFTAPPLRPFPAPAIEVRRKNRGLVIHWVTIPGASGYRLVIDRSDGPTDVIDVLAHRARVGGITARTSTTITVQAFTEAGYLGKVGTMTVRPG